jgi:hypothetical protein
VFGFEVAIKTLWGRQVKEHFSICLFQIVILRISKDFLRSYWLDSLLLVVAERGGVPEL